MYPSPLNIYVPSRTSSKEMFFNGEGNQVRWNRSLATPISLGFWSQLICPSHLWGMNCQLHFSNEDTEIQYDYYWWRSQDFNPDQVGLIRAPINGSSLLLILTHVDWRAINGKLWHDRFWDNLWLPGFALLAVTVAIFVSTSYVSDTRMGLRSHLILVSCSVVCHLATPWTIPLQAPGRNTGVGGHFLLQGIFSIQGQNPGLPHCRQILLPSEPPRKHLFNP